MQTGVKSSCRLFQQGIPSSFPLSSTTKKIEHNLSEYLPDIQWIFKTNETNKLFIIHL